MTDQTPIIDAQSRLRRERATTLCMAIADTDPDDAVQIMTAALQDMVIESPIPGFNELETDIRRDAAWWLSAAPDLEVQVYLDMTVKHVARRATGVGARKRFIAALWNGLGQADKDAFLKHIGKAAQ